MKRIGRLSSILFHHRRRMKIVKEAGRGHKVEKAAISKKEFKIEHAEHIHEPAVGTGNTVVLMTKKSLKAADYGAFDKRMKVKRKPFETCSGNSKRNQILIFDRPMKKKPNTDSGKLKRKQRACIEAGTYDKRMKEKRKPFVTYSRNSKRKQTLIFDQPMKKKPKLLKTDSGKLERKQRAPIEVSDSGCPGSDSDLKPGMDIKAFELDKKSAFIRSFFSGPNPRRIPFEGRRGEFPKLRFVPPSEEGALRID